MIGVIPFVKPRRSICTQLTVGGEVEWYRYEDLQIQHAIKFSMVVNPNRGKLERGEGWVNQRKTKTLKHQSQTILLLLNREQGRWRAVSLEYKPRREQGGKWGGYASWKRTLKRDGSDLLFILYLYIFASRFWQWRKSPVGKKKRHHSAKSIDKK